ncbi:MAG: hypothetical protein ACYDGY_08970 [Acidimicrobiales bacterium]
MRLRTPEAPFVPYKTSRTTGCWKIDEFNQAAFLDYSRGVAMVAKRTATTTFDVDNQATARLIFYSKHIYAEVVRQCARTCV